MAEHTIEWLTPDGRPAKARGKDSVEDTVSHLPKVMWAVQKKALSMGGEAQVLLLAHRRQGHAAVRVGRFRSPPGARTPDWYVYLQDPDPGGILHRGNPEHIAHRSVMSMEFGWTQTHAFGKKLAEPIEHDGIGILGSVMGRAVSRYTGPQ